MSAENRDASIKITLGYEGGYTNNPRDPGGPTNWGITIADARMYWKADATYLDVKAMPLSVAMGIYQKRYWDKMACDGDPAGVDLVTFDYGVNSGTGRAIPCRSKNRKPSIVDWTKAICDERLNFLTHLKTWSVFGKGWGSRVANVKARGVKMALVSTGATSDAINKRLTAEATTADKKSKSNGAAAGTTAAAPTSTQIPDAPHHIDVSSLDLSSKIGLGIAAAVLLAVTVYFVWWWWHRRLESIAFTEVASET